MAKRIGKYTVEMTGGPVIKAFASSVGKKESEGPLGKEFDKVFEDTTLKEPSWERLKADFKPKRLKSFLKNAAWTLRK